MENMNNLLLLAVGLFGLILIVIGIALYNKESKEETHITEKLVAMYVCPNVEDTIVYVYKQDIHDLPPFYQAYHYNLNLGQRFKQGSGFNIVDALKDSEMILGGSLEYVSRLGYLGLKTTGDQHEGHYTIRKADLCSRDVANITLDALLEVAEKQRIELSKGVQNLIALHLELESSR